MRYDAGSAEFCSDYFGEFAGSARRYRMGYCASGASLVCSFGARCGRCLDAGQCFWGGGSTPTYGFSDEESQGLVTQWLVSAGVSGFASGIV